MDNFKLLAILSPFISAFLVGFSSYYFNLKNKRFDILYQYKLPAFKEMSVKFIELKKYCTGQIGLENTPYLSDKLQAKELRAGIIDSYDNNAIFLNSKTRRTIEFLINQMRTIVRLEDLAEKEEVEFKQKYKDYTIILGLTNNCIEVLYKDLDLK